MSLRPHGERKALADTPISTLVALLQDRATEYPTETAYLFLDDGRTEGASLTYAELDRRARGIAAALRDAGVQKERLLLVYPTGTEFVTAFFGCLYAGCVAVPSPPYRSRRTLPRLQTIVANANASVALTTRDVLHDARRQSRAVEGLAELNWIATDFLDDAVHRDFTPARLEPDDLALLQYTSGSTASPRGVMVSHANLIGNLEMCQAAFSHPAGEAIVSWLPFFHDMGLIVNMLLAPFVRAPLVFMQPVSFLHNPINWLRALSQYKGVTAGAPNFAYDLCVRATTEQQRAGLDLSAWKVAYNAAEPVRVETLDRFAEAFAPYGFRRETLNPSYGLAEAVAIVSGGPRCVEPRIQTISGKALELGRVEAVDPTSADAKSIVGCGQTLPGERIIIADPDTLARCSPGTIGEILVAGPHVGGGYWNRPDETTATFGAHLSDTGEGPCLRTGDLGFVDRGDVFVTGRLKDLIVIQGRNYYPQDIELSVEQGHPAVNAHATAAFSIDAEGSEQLVIVAELKRSHRKAGVDDVFLKIHEAVLLEHELDPYSIVLVRPESLPKTSSGKVARRACRDAFQTSALKSIDHWERNDSAPASLDQLDDSADLVLVVLTIWQTVLRRADLSVDDDFFEAGGNSLTAAQVVSRLEERLDVSLPVRDLFEARTATVYAARVEAMRASGARHVLSIPRRSPTVQDLPLSYAQQGVWFLHQVDPVGSAYNFSIAYDLHGPLDAQALERSLIAIAERHEVLRTTFIVCDGRAVQHIDRAAVASLRMVDHSSAPAADVASELQQTMAGERQQPFSLSTGPMWRTLLVKTGDERHRLMLTMHHIVTDGWSVGVLLHELGEFYRYFATGEEPSLPSLPIQYADFALWQRETTFDDVIKPHLAYWREQLAAAPELTLPTDRPRTAARGDLGASATLKLPEEFVGRLRTLCDAEKSTLFMTLLAAFECLLSRYTGQEDFVVGAPVAHRNRTDTENLIGFFVDSILLRSDVSGGPTFRELLARVRTTCLDAYAHEDVPFEKLVEELQPDRDPRRNPLFQVAFALNNTPPESLTLEGIQIEDVDSLETATRFDQEWNVRETAHGLRIDVIYNTDLFDRKTIQRMQGHYEVLLAAALNDPDRRIAVLPLLTETERQQMLVEWNDTSVPYPDDACVQELFSAQAARTPEKTAVVFGDQTLSYAELDARSNQLARSLIRRGVGPEVPVPLLVERSLEMVVGVLGILKAGGAYVPLDPHDPPERLSGALDDVGASLVLTQERLRARLSASSFECFCLDADRATWNDESTAPLRVETGPKDLAYLMYTSGSTGRPKAVAVPHQAINRLVLNTNYLSLEADDIVLQLAPLAFDASTFEIWGALLNGACLAVAPPGLLSLAEIGLALSSNNVTTLFLTTVLFHLMVDEQPHSLAGLRYLLAGGDVLSVEHVNRFLESSTQTRLIVAYGPTENTTFTSCQVMPPGSRVEQTVPLGRPIANTQVYVLDDRLRPVCVGVPGELCVAGAGLARGYWKRPDLTSQRFVPNPFGEGRLYRTGDRVRYRDGGEIEFLGRFDNQLKIRGHRVEPGEIESVLRQHPGVRETTVDVRVFSDRTKQLVAYIVADADRADAGAFQEHLERRLPAYMTPAEYVFLDALPITQRGKIDHEALSAIELAQTARSAECEQPMTDRQRLLASIWADVLGVSHVSVSDNYFELGGDSIRSIQIVSRAAERGIHITVRQLFEHQTVHELANVAVESRIDETSEETSTEPFPLLPIQAWFLSRQLVDPHHFNQSLMFETDESLDETHLRHALGHVIEQHEMLRVRLRQTGGKWEQTIAAPGDDIPFWTVDLSDVPSAEQEATVRRQTEALQADFELEGGLLIRVAHFKRGEIASDLLLFIVHHLAVDVVSWPILFHDFEAAYRAFSSSNAPSVARRTGSYRSWANRLHERAQSKTVLEQKPDWVSRLDRPAVLLPRDFPHETGLPSAKTSRQVTVTLSAEQTELLLHVVHKPYRTNVEDLLLTALVQSFSEWTGESSLLIDREHHGRVDLWGDIDLSRTVGWFTSLYPVHIELRKGGSLSDDLKSIKEQLRQVADHGIGYGLLRYTRQDASITHEFEALPQADVSLNYLGDFHRMFDSSRMFRPVREFADSMCSGENERSHLLEIIAWVDGGELQLSWTFSNTVHRRETIESLAERLLRALSKLIDHCKSPEAGGLTPSDFPDADLSQEELDAFVEHLDDEAEPTVDEPE